MGAGVSHIHGFHDGEYQDGEVRGRVFLCGASGFGKTTEMRRLLHQCAGGTVMFNPTGRDEGAVRGSVTVETAGELKNFLRLNLNKRFRVEYIPTSGDIVEHGRDVCGIVEAFGSMTLALDEVDMLCGPEWGQSRVPPELYKLVHFGRHAGNVRNCPGWNRRGVALLYTARIPTSAARCLTSQASELRLFHEHEPEYVDYYAKAIHSRTDAQKLITLPKYHFFIWRNGEALQAAGGARRLF